jgi:DNA polymerase V
MSEKLYILADANNFFVSCERVFQPQYRQKPVVVLSNNDGCVVSRSAEAKALGIPMGKPYFQLKELLQKKKVKVFSSNFELYSDFSHRLMSLLQAACPDLEQYSVDEAFLPSTLDRKNAQQLAQQLHQNLLQQLSLPVSFGIATSKTLAKLANHLAKKTPTGVFLWPENPLEAQQLLSNTDVHEIWGIGGQSARKLYQMGIQTAWQFQKMNPLLVKSQLGIMGQRIQSELAGQDCLSEIRSSQDQKAILCSRSFGQSLRDQQSLRSALASFVEEACQKLQQQKSCASSFSFFLQQKATAEQLSQRQSQFFHLPQASAYPADFLQLITAELPKLFDASKSYHKAGVCFFDLQKAQHFQASLLEIEQTPKNLRHEKLLDSLQGLRRRFGQHSLHFASSQLDHHWQSRQDRRSPRFSTRLNEIPLAH